MADWSKAKLGAYHEGRKLRAVYVPCERDEDPRVSKKTSGKKPAKKKAKVTE